MNSIFTYMWQHQQYKPWKSVTQMQNSAVPTWSGPLTNGRIVPVVNTYAGKDRVVYDKPNGPSFKARPIKHWRKQLDPRKGSGQGRPGIGMPIDIPGGSVALGNNNSDVNSNEKNVGSNCECANAKRMKEYIMPDNRYSNQKKSDSEMAKMKFLNPDRDNPRSVCVECSPQNHVIKRATTILNKKYYTDSRAYLRARNKRYLQNLSGTDMEGIVYYNKDNKNVEHNNNGSDMLWPSDNQNNVRWNGPQIRAGANCTPNCCKQIKEVIIQVPTTKHGVTQTGKLPEEATGEYFVCEANDIPQNILESYQHMVFYKTNGQIPVENVEVNISECYVNSNGEFYIIKFNLQQVAPGNCQALLISKDSKYTFEQGNETIEGSIIEGGVIEPDAPDSINFVSCDLDLSEYEWIDFDSPTKHGKAFSRNVINIETTNIVVEEKCQAPIIYKPNNRKFSVQGAVDSSTRIDRLKLNTITKSANSQKTRFGHEGATASRYRGNVSAPYYLKSKYQVPLPHRKNGDKELCCSNFIPTL